MINWSLPSKNFKNFCSRFFFNFLFFIFFKIIISADQLVRAQQESTRLRERLSDFDFFKARVEELQKENSNLYDARAALETEIAANRIRLAGMNDQVSHQKYSPKYSILRILDSPNTPIQRIH